jgi:hypothetical protein
VGLTVDLTVPAGLEQLPGPERIRALTDHDGRYELVHVPPGRFILGINMMRDRDGGFPHPPVFYPGVEQLADAQRIALAPGQRTEMNDFVLPSDLGYVQISGSVVEADGAPAAGARVYLKGPEETDYVLSEPAVADRDGRFVLAALGGRKYRLFAERTRGEGASSRIDSSEQLPLTADENGSPVRLTLRRRY